MPRPVTCADEAVERHPWLALALWVLMILAMGFAGAVE